MGRTSRVSTSKDLRGDTIIAFEERPERVVRELRKARWAMGSTIGGFTALVYCLLVIREPTLDSLLTASLLLGGVALAVWLLPLWMQRRFVPTRHRFRVSESTVTHEVVPASPDVQPSMLSRDDLDDLLLLRGPIGNVSIARVTTDGRVHHWRLLRTTRATDDLTDWREAMTRLRSQLALPAFAAELRSLLGISPAASDPAGG